MSTRTGAGRSARRFGFGIAVALCASGVRAQAPSQPADLIVTRARVVTLDPARPSATAVAVRGGNFVAVGEDREVARLRGPKTRVVDGGGRTLIPGLNDSHLHPTRGGRFYALELRWDGVDSLATGLRMLREQAARTPQGQWVRVIGGWSPAQFAERRMPTLEELNAAAPDTPVFVLHLYSRGMLNRAGLRALGITAETQPPPGSRFERGPDGQPSGLLVADPNPAILYVTIARLPPLSKDDQVVSTRHFYRELNRFGITSVIDAGGGGHQFPDDYAGSAALAASGQLPLRISYYLFPQRPGHELEDFQRWTAENKPDTNGDKLRPNGYVLEGGGEALTASAVDFENFLAARPELADRPKWRGELTPVARELVAKGWPIRIHATYDESISHILDVFEQIDGEERAAGRRGFAGIRWAIDHAETVSPKSLDRIHALGGGVAIQDRLAFAGEDFVARYGADSARAAPPIREMLRRGIPVGAGTDGTRVSSYNPWVSLYWLVSGKTVGGLQLTDEPNRLGREDALRLWTAGSAWFSGEEKLKGRIKAGQYADFALLSADYLSVPEEQIKRIESVLTVVGGQPVFAATPYAGLVPTPLPPIKPEWSPVAFYGGYAPKVAP
ncbi:MAG TPA: amidohydrolase [Myxococcales bacterium]|nr:amidohydrolase [Myxococcales bacterium]